MKNFIILFSLLIANTIFLSFAFAEDNKTLLAIEYIELSKAKETAEKQVETYVNELAATNPKHNKDQIRAFYNVTQGWNVLKEPMVRIVKDTFTEDELKAANEFLKSKNGATFAKKLPLITEAITKQVSDNSIKAFTKKPKK